MAKALRKSLGLTLLRPNTRFLLIAGVMFFFWAIYDGTISFIAPLLVTEHGFSDAQMGMIISMSSVFGALFDMLMGKFLKDPHWKSVFMLMFISSALAIVAFWSASTLALFMLAMAMWGLYFNFTMFGMYDFVSVNALEKDRGKEYGIINIFRFLGYIIAPLVLGFLIVDDVGLSAFVFLSFGLTVSFAFYLLLAKEWKPVERTMRRVHTLKALHSIFRDGTLLLPVLIFLILYNVVEAFFWTIGPLLAVQFHELHPWEGLFVTAYFLPMLLTGWFVGGSTNAFGKKRTAFLALATGSLFLLGFFVITNPIILIGIIFVSSMFSTFALPCINAAIADYVSDDRRDENRLEAMVDFSSNVGYIIGPALAGLLASIFGDIAAFGYLGVGSLVITLALLWLSPARITLVKHPVS